MANNFSQMIAMFCLILFYTVFREELAPLKPIRQYLCIKFVVFATFWQSVLLAILVKFDIISINHWPYFPTLIDTVNGLQDFLICIEMFVAAVAHILAFPATPYIIERQDRHNWVSNIANAANVSDFNTEVKEHLSHFSTRVRKALNRSGRNSESATSSAGLLNSESSEKVANEAENAHERSNLLIDSATSINSDYPSLTTSNYGGLLDPNGPTVTTVHVEPDDDIAIEI